MDGKRARIGVLTDTIADLPDQFVAKYGINVIPVKVHVGDKTYLDKVEMTKEQFLKLLEKGAENPKTSQPSPYDFQVVFEKMLGEYDKIIAVHASSDLSGTFHSAVMAKEALGEKAEGRIALFDTRQASMGEGLIALKAGEMVYQGAEVDGILAELSRISSNMRTRFVPDTLTYLQRGGRIGKASAFLGNILSIKPLLGVDGQVYPIEKIRGGRNVVPKLVEQFKSDLGPSDRARVTVISSNMPEEHAALDKLINEDGRASEIIYASMGAAIGCHVGPKVIGLIWHKL